MMKLPAGNYWTGATVSHYRSNLRDLEFNLFEAPGAAEDGGHPVFGRGPFADLDVDTSRGILTEVERLAREDLAASYTSGDRQPPDLRPGHPHGPGPG